MQKNGKIGNKIKIVKKFEKYLKNVLTITKDML